MNSPPRRLTGAVLHGVLATSSPSTTGVDGGGKVIRSSGAELCQSKVDGWGARLNAHAMWFWEQLVGQIVEGAFPLRECLGTAEDSAVFLTELQYPGPRAAVIRLLLSEGREAKLRFSRWELAARLSHPNLLRIFRTGPDRLSGVAVLYVVFEYAAENLKTVLLDRPLTPAEARQMLEPALSALMYLHGQGLVHGHLQPANIFAIEDQLKLSVDGLGRTGEAVVTRPSVYDPPELATGEVSPAGDIWSLGMTLVEALTQSLPEGLPPREPVVPETLPEPFLDIARHCLKRAPGDRWTAAEIADRLRQPVRAAEATPVKAPRSFWQWRYVAPASVTILLAMFALIGISRRPDSSTGSRVPIKQPSVPAGGQTAAPPAAPSTPTPPDAKRSVKASAPSPRESQKRSTPGEVVEQVLPAVPPKISNTIRGRVRVSVRVLVDAAGGVTGATLDSRGPSRYFADLALPAARRWKFTPAKIGDRAVASEWVLRFEFLRTGTTVTPLPATP